MTDSATSLRLGGHEVSTAHMIFGTPPPIDYVFGNLSLVAGTAGLLYAPGDTGKSWLLLEMCIAIALAGTDAPGSHASDLLRFRPVPPPRGHQREGKGWQVVYLTAEDPDDQLHYRLHHSADGLTTEQRNLLAENLRVRSWQGDKLLDVLGDGVDYELIEYCKTSRFVGVDTLSRFHRAVEKDNGEMSRVVNVFERVAHAGPAVVTAHHDTKAAITDGSTKSMHAARGASAIADNLRWGFALARCAESNDLLVGSEGKHSYGTLHANLFFRRNRYGVLEATDAPEQDVFTSTKAACGRRGTGGLY